MVVWSRSGSRSLNRFVKNVIPCQRQEILLDKFDISLQRYITHRLGGDNDELLANRASGGSDLNEVVNLWVFRGSFLVFPTSICMLTSLFTLSMKTSLE